MSISLQGVPEGINVVEICHGNRVRGRFELHGKKITKGGRFAVSAVVVEPAPGYEFVQQKAGHYWVQKKSDTVPEGATVVAEASD